MAILQHSTNMPIATGEGLQTQFNFYGILEKQAAQFDSQMYLGRAELRP